jgi:hypothetical protein
MRPTATDWTRLAPLAWWCAMLLSGCVGASPAARAVDSPPFAIPDTELAALIERAELGAAEESELRQTSAELKRRMTERPRDVAVLLLAARFAIVEDRSQPQMIRQGEPPPTAESVRNDPAAVHALLDRALVLQPRSAEAHYWKARVYGTRVGIIRNNRIYRVARDLSRAVTFATRAVELAPGQASYREALALYQFARGRLDDAIAAVSPLGRASAIPRLLADLKAFPVLKEYVLLEEDGEAFGEQQVMRGRISDYQQLRVRFYVVPQSAADLEAFFQTHWSGFRLYPISDEGVAAGGRVRILAEYFRWNADVLSPAASEEDFRRGAENPTVEGLILTVAEFRDLPASERKTSPAGAPLPTNLGAVYCYLIVVNGRPIQAP